MLLISSGSWRRKLHLFIPIGKKLRYPVYFIFTIRQYLLWLKAKDNNSKFDLVIGNKQRLHNNTIFNFPTVFHPERDITVCLN